MGNIVVSLTFTANLYAALLQFEYSFLPLKQLAVRMIFSELFIVHCHCSLIRVIIALKISVTNCI